MKLFSANAQYSWFEFGATTYRLAQSAVFRIDIVTDNLQRRYVFGGEAVPFGAAEHHCV